MGLNDLACFFANGSVQAAVQAQEACAFRYFPLISRV